MQNYFSTFISGTGDIIKNILKKKSDKIKIYNLFDGLVIYNTSYQLRDIRNFRFFNNSFVLLKFFKKLNSNPVEQMIKELIKDSKLRFNINKFFSDKKRTFKIMTSVENQTVSIDKNLIKKLEFKIKQHIGLKLDINKPDLEFWLSARKEGFGLFGVRITYKERILLKGQIRPELAHILCVLSEPTPKDIFLDPFLGYGSIPSERSISFPYKDIIAIDKDIKLVNQFKRKFLKNKKQIQIKQGDVLNLVNIENSSIDKIVTDPPWGIYEKTEIPIFNFYCNMLKEFYRVLKQNGIIVILTGSKTEFENAVKELNYFIVISVYNILVSGKKSAVYKLKKRN